MASKRQGLRAILALAVLVVLPVRALSQTITLDPDCGRAGVQSVQVKGSGWASKFQDIDNYTKAQQFWFFFDGQEVTSRQNVLQDDQQPSTAFLVPVGASPGNHSFRIELRYCPPGPAIFYRRQCVEIPFRVVLQEQDPWENGFTYTGWPSPISRGASTITFDPTDACTVDECPEIYLIQAVRYYATQNGMRRVFRPSEFFVHPDRADLIAEQRLNSALDSLTTGAGMRIDNLAKEATPYYNSGDPGYGHPGSQNPYNPVPSVMFDAPNFPLIDYLSLNITTIEQAFEVNAFCGAGPNAGSYLGHMTWKRNYTIKPTVFAVEPTQCSPAICTQGQPSADFLAALNLWIQRKGFPLPAPPTQTADLPRTGGVPCRD